MIQLSDHRSSALISGAIAYLINPIEVLKTRSQLLNKTKVMVKKPNVFKVWTIGIQPSVVYHMFSGYTAAVTLKFLDHVGVDKPIRNESFKFKSSLKLSSIIGVPSAILPSPLYLVKIRFQSNTSLDSGLRVGYQHQLRNGGTISLLKNVIETEYGPRALYRAALSNYIRYVTMTSVAMYTFVKVQNSIQATDKRESSAISAIIGGVVGAYIASPLDLISTRLYNQGVSRYGGNMEYKGFKDCLSRLIFVEGLSAFFKQSLPSTLSLSIHMSALLYLWDHFNLIYMK